MNVLTLALGLALTLSLSPATGLEQPDPPPPAKPHDPVPPTSVVGPGSFPLGTGTTSWPLTPRPLVVAPFVAPSSLFGAGHRGVDLLGIAGQPVLAAADGVVAFVGSVAGKPVVSVAHPQLGPDVRTTYEPVVATVFRGERVGAGQVIGLLQPAPSHCAPSACLHWGLLHAETYVDPLTLLVGWSVVLKPWGGPAGTPPAAARR